MMGDLGKKIREILDDSIPDAPAQGGVVIYTERVVIYTPAPAEAKEEGEPTQQD
ncbi:MAG: hypothetical protein LAT50_16900 [Ectothiorhodospiraceae bacterium]|nr:hypothetical protein [Ectothiorhodospiraceae bacterium]